MVMRNNIEEKILRKMKDACKAIGGTPEESKIVPLPGIVTLKCTIEKNDVEKAIIAEAATGGLWRTMLKQRRDIKRTVWARVSKDLGTEMTEDEASEIDEKLEGTNCYIALETSWDEDFGPATLVCETEIPVKGTMKYAMRKAKKELEKLEKELRDVEAILKI